VNLPHCPVCDAQIEYPDVPKRRAIKDRRGVLECVVIDYAPCSTCPAEVTFREDTGTIVGFRPNQPITVRRVPGT
jgi:hypothetical protein